METNDKQVKYNLLPMLPPWADLTIDSELMLKLLDASRRLSRLDGFVSRLPNRELYIKAIVFREARTSCALDGLRKTNFLVNKYQDILLNESVNIAGGKRLTEETLLNIYSELRSGLGYGHFKNKAVETQTMTFLTQFINNTYNLPKDPLFRMAMLQYQFEATQPFVHGDGRAGRLINILYLIQEGLLSQPCFCLSACYIRHPNDYSAAVKSVGTSRNWRQWVMHTLNSICCASGLTMDLIQRIQDLQEKMDETIRQNGLQLDRMDDSVLLSIPYISPRQLMSGSIKSVNTAKKYLGQLEKLGLLSKTRVGREYVWVNTGLMEILSE